MGDRLSARDLVFLTRETVTAQHHLGSIEILDPGESGFDYDTLLHLVADRLSFVPRYRQRVQLVPGRLANPVWVDDDRFDIEYHVRRSAVPRPGRWTSCATSSAGSSPGRWTALGRCGRSTTSRGWPRAGWRC